MKKRSISSPRKSRSKVKYISRVLVACLLAIIIFLIWQFGQKNSSNDTDLNNPNIQTIVTGTQGHFEDLYIGVGNIQDNSTILYLHQGKTDLSTQKKVTAGDKFEAYGYAVEVKSIKEAFNLSSKPGSNHGSVKLYIHQK